MNSAQTQALSPPAFYQAQINRLLAHQQAIEAELACRNLQDLPIEKLFRLSDLLSRHLQRLLVAAHSSTEIKLDQASAETAELSAPDSGAQRHPDSSGNPQPSTPAASAILAAGEGAILPPVASESGSTSIKLDQASNETVAPVPPPAAEAQGSEPKAQSATVEVQGSPSVATSAPK